MIESSFEGLTLVHQKEDGLNLILYLFLENVKPNTKKYCLNLCKWLLSKYIFIRSICFSWYEKYVFKEGSVLPATNQCYNHKNVFSARKSEQELDSISYYEAEVGRILELILVL